MPPRARYNQRSREECVEELSQNSLICHMVSVGMEMHTKPLSEFTDEDGTPLMRFLLDAHDNYWALHEDYRTYRFRGQLTHFEAFGEAALKARARERQTQANYIREPDIEHPDVTEYIRMWRDGASRSDLRRRFQRPDPNQSAGQRLTVSSTGRLRLEWN